MKNQGVGGEKVRVEYDIYEKGTNLISKGKLIIITDNKTVGTIIQAVNEEFELK